MSHVDVWQNQYNIVKLKKKRELKKKLNKVVCLFQKKIRLLHRGPVVKNLPANAGDAGSILGLGRSLGGGNVSPLQNSCLENPMNRGAWCAPSGQKESDMSEQLGMHTCVRNQDLGARCVHCYWVFMASRRLS